MLLSTRVMYLSFESVLSQCALAGVIVVVAMTSSASGGTDVWLEAGKTS